MTRGLGAAVCSGFPSWDSGLYLVHPKSVLPSMSRKGTEGNRKRQRFICVWIASGVDGSEGGCCQTEAKFFDVGLRRKRFSIFHARLLEINWNSFSYH